MPVNETGSKPRWGTGKPLMTRRGRVVVLSAACLVAVTIAFVQRQTSAREESPSSVETRPQLAAAEPAAAPKTAPKAAPRAAARKPAAAASTRPAASAATTLPVPVKSDMTTAVTAPAPRQETAPVDVVTISGCLEQDDERFRLKDTSGDDVPKGRSWKSGFLRKSSPTIDVIDQTNRHHLPTYVGQRVSVTGTLVEREMQVRSVRIVAISCEEKSA